VTTLNVRAFFFNAKTDYLPYYKSFKISVDENKSVVEILKAIQDQNEIFSFPQERIVFRINDLVVNETTIISEVVEKLGKELTIEPVNSYRSTNGLIINDDDFMQSFFLLEPYATESDKAHFETH
jgi:succinate dehydrogenase/fumarate reductase-like Fe-S protein